MPVLSRSWLHNHLEVKFSQLIPLPFVVNLEPALYLCENENIVIENLYMRSFLMKILSMKKFSMKTLSKRGINYGIRYIQH